MNTDGEGSLARVGLVCQGSRRSKFGGPGLLSQVNPGKAGGLFPLAPQRGRFTNPQIPPNPPLSKGGILGDRTRAFPLS
jgi:hypothetical protein